MAKAYQGHILYTKDPDRFEIYENGAVIVEDGKVVEVLKTLPENLEALEVFNMGDRLIIPGFVDLHFHAPQFPNLGLGLDKELLPWLEDYTFPEEAKYSDLDYAESVYTRVAKEIWRQGTTRIVLFSSVHKESTQLLMSIFDRAGLGAYVGKVNMDRNCPDFLVESTMDSIEATKAWLEATVNLYPKVKPLITPRFVPTCTSELMRALGDLAAEYNVPVQTHISENQAEVDWVRELHPESADYATVYEDHGLMGDKTILAHCVHNTDAEIEKMSKLGVFAAHCPNANYNLASGIMPVRKFLNAGVKVGLGTDVGAGHKVSIASVMSTAIQASKIAWLNSDRTLAPLSTSEAFYLGTKGGGAYFGKVGSFEPGYEFDALVIDDHRLGVTEGRTVEERLQRFLYIGDDRDIISRFVSGDEIMEPTK
ncbi:MAG: guanine deaminase [Acidaminobacter sp.]|uniref:guanine deaminase n=1 Tax=Acidaminobacter sp. TaxID=1872102 RepID=UPI001386168A|nr:guanine deaminase [Acidaminobacter sp.]MZQ96620.1 guanine deaminase [Acidaminobacter sp.]